ncbi:MAG: hypothetical protein R6V05_07555 [Candidatus Brocadiia bacterium]
MILKGLVKTIVSVIVGVAVLVVLLGLGAMVLLGHVVEAGIERVGPVVTRVPLEVDDVDISLFGGTFTLHGFKMGNPEGYEAAHATTVGRTQVSAELRSLLSDEIVLHRVEVDQPSLTVEFKGGQTNLGAILANARMPEKRSDKRIRLGVLRITEPSVQLAGLPAGQSVELRLPDIELTDLSAGGEAKSPAELIAAVLEAIQEKILAEISDRLPAERLEALRGELEGKVEEGREALDQAREELEEEAGGLLKDLKLPGSE